MESPINIDLGLLRFQDQLETQSKDGKTYIKDPIRRKWIILVPEELVRQLVILYLFDKVKPLKRLISVEKQITVNGIIKRFDLLVYDNNASPLLLVECKAPGVSITDRTFEQISLYNMSLHVPYLLVTNGLESYFCTVDWKSKTYSFRDSIILF